jgi:hypothetical protein
MSRSPFFFLERINPTTGQAEFVEIQASKKGELVSVDLFPYNGCHGLFSIVEERIGDYPEMVGIQSGLPFGASPRIKSEYENCKEYGCKMRWFNYSDMVIYALKYPKVKEVDDEGEITFEDNPIFILKNRVDAFIDLWDAWNGEDKSLYRIVYWIDY